MVGVVHRKCLIKMVKEIKFTKKDYEEMLNILTKDHIRLVKCLLEKHRKVWREYEDEKMNGKRIVFVKLKGEEDDE